MKKADRSHQIVWILVAAFALCILALSWNQVISRKEASGPTEQQETPTLESLLGEDYVQFLTDTVTMQMKNRMEKDPEVRYYPIADNAPLDQYVEIGDTQFEADEEGYLTIIFPAGTVTAWEHGEQRFRIIQVTAEAADHKAG